MNETIRTLMLSTLSNIAQTLLQILNDVLPLALGVIIGYVVISMGIKWFLNLIGFRSSELDDEELQEFDDKWDREEKAVAYNDYVRHRIDDEEY